MKYTTIAIAVCGVFSTTAFAQSNVTVYGSIDAGLRNVTNVNAAGDDKLTMGSNGTFRSNRLGFKGSEDLGDGLKANFVLESGFNSGTGGPLTFERETRVGLSGRFGSVDLGRQYTVAYKTILAFDPFVYSYPSITYAISSTAGTRNSNDIQYAGQFGDVTLLAEYAFGEKEGSTSNAATQAVGLKYASGPVRLGASYTKGKPNTGSTANPTYNDYEHFAIGGAYKFGAATASLGYVDETQKTATLDATRKWAWAGMSYNVSSAWTVTGAWYRIKVFNSKATGSIGAGDGKKDMFMLGATYALSKRTTLYSEIDTHKLGGSYATGGTTALNQTRQTGISAGIMHTF